MLTTQYEWPARSSCYNLNTQRPIFRRNIHENTQNLFSVHVSITNKVHAYRPNKTLNPPNIAKTKKTIEITRK